MNASLLAEHAANSRTEVPLIDIGKTSGPKTWSANCKICTDEQTLFPDINVATDISKFCIELQSCGQYGCRFVCSILLTQTVAVGGLPIQLKVGSHTAENTCDSSAAC